MGGGVAGGGEPGGFAEPFLGGEAEQAQPAAQVAQQCGGLVGGDGVAVPLAVPALAGQGLGDGGVQVAVVGGAVGGAGA